MFKSDYICGLSRFLHGLLYLIKNNHAETTEFIEENLSNDLATQLYKKYPKEFSVVGLSTTELKEINSYYGKLAGSEENKEMFFSCSVNDGLYFLLGLTINRNIC